MSQDLSHGVALDELFPAARTSGSASVVVGQCTSDWRLVRPGDAYVAVLAEECDGHDHVARAVKRGAKAIIAEQLVPAAGVPVYVVGDSRTAYGELCHALAGHPSRQMRVVGVVGDQGKSTVVALLESIFSKAGCQVGMLSSLASFDGMSVGLGVADAISPAVLATRLAHMDAAGCTHAFVEISSRALCQQKLAGIELDTLIATRVDAAHLDIHHTTQNYRDAQQQALDYLSPAGVAVFDADDPVACRWLATLDAASLTYGIDDDDAQITADIVARNACETVFVLVAGCESAAVRTSIVGDAHVSNCLAAAAAALAHGVDLQTIAAGIEALDRLPARMERVDCGQDFAVFVDAAQSPPALRATLRSARQISRGRVICVLGDVPAAPAEASAVRSIVEKMADLAIAIDAVCVEADWPTPADAGNFQIADDRVEAIAWAIAAAEPGDVVVIAGSRGPTEGGFGVSECTDADAVREMLYAKAPTPLRLVG
jgi:UDP-N-acetylmuramoyl-L-alanyl-D-glutamate--2,6-diaminopimelate ligase